jgi:hypothetical protein
VINIAMVRAVSKPMMPLSRANKGVCHSDWLEEIPEHHVRLRAVQIRDRHGRCMTSWRGSQNSSSSTARASSVPFLSSAFSIRRTCRAVTANSRSTCTWLMCPSLPSSITSSGFAPAVSLSVLRDFPLPQPDPVKRTFFLLAQTGHYHVARTLCESLCESLLTRPNL